MSKVLTNKKIRKIKNELPFFLMLLPAALCVFMFSYVPLSGIILAFKDSDPLAIKNGIFAAPWAANHGFQNIIDIFRMPDISSSIWNTFYLNLLGLIFSFPAPLLFAIMLNEIRQKIFKKSVQSISYLPYFLSWISVTGLTTTLLTSSGAVNDIIFKLAGKRILFLENPKNFTPIYIFLTVWKSIGWGSIIFLATISSIDSQLYEAAKIDGAGYLSQAVHITLPSLVPTTIILLIMQLGQMFGSNFELVYGLQNLDFTKEVISTLVYKRGIMRGNYALSTALGFLQGIIALILTLGANFVAKKVSQTSLF